MRIHGRKFIYMGCDGKVFCGKVRKTRRVAYRLKDGVKGYWKMIVGRRHMINSKFVKFI